MSTSLHITERSLHLVDLENLAGDPRAATHDALAVFDDYLIAARWRPGDHVIVASNPSLIGRVMYHLPVAANVHAASGRDGADTMLLSLAPAEWIAKRFDRLVVGSGDGIFAGRAHAVRGNGSRVAVVARPDGCSARLRTFDCTYLAPRAGVVLAA